MGVWSARRVVPAAALAGLVLLAFWPVLRNDFVDYDDEWYIARNWNAQQGLTLDGVAWAFSTTYAANWHPLTWISHMVDFSIYGPRAWGHHLTSLLLHLATTLFLFLVLERTTGSAGRSAFVAALFGVHPLHVESVAWVSERKDVLSAFLGILAVAAYVRYARAPSARRMSVVAVLLALGLLAKPMLVTLPFVFALLDLWPLGRVKGDRLPELARGAARLLREKIPLLVLAAASSVVTVAAQHSGGAIGTAAQYPFLVRLANAALSYVAYLGQTIWPTNLAVFYPHPRGSVSGASAVLAAVFLILVTAGAVRAARSHPYLPTGWFLYVGMLAPVIGLIQVGGQARADRYTYLPLIGIFVIAAWGVPDAIRSAIGRGSGTTRSAATLDRALRLSALGWIVVPPLVLLTRAQCEVWRDSISLNRHAIAVTRDNDVAHGNLGAALARRGRTDEAIVHYREALRINPGDAESLANLAFALTGLGRSVESVELCRRAIELNPKFAGAHNNLGLALAMLGRDDEAIRSYRRAIEIAPNLAEAHNNLGAMLDAKGRGGEALEHLTRALELQPRYAAARHNLGMLHERQGRLDRAIAEYERAAVDDPSYAAAQGSLGRALARTGRFAEASERFAKALDLGPESAVVHHDLAFALAAVGRREEAVKQYEEALKLQPDYAEAHNNLGAVLLELGRSQDGAAHIARAVELRPSYGKARSNLAAVLAMAGQYADAWKEVRAARSLGVEPPPALLDLLRSRSSEPAGD